jgi:Co/Zn/Cd efflux system component
MTACCAPGPVQAEQRRVLQAVLAINLAMFLVETGAALAGRSTALLADGADMLGDALVYGVSLQILGRGPVWQARAALLKGVVMAGFGLAVALEVAAKLARGLTPDAAIMAGTGLLALGANAVVLGLLWRHRADDLNMRSVWLCSRNDVLAGVAVLLAAAAVALVGSAWPDVAVGLAIAALFTGSAAGVIRAALRSPARTPAA